MSAKDLADLGISTNRIGFCTDDVSAADAAARAWLPVPLAVHVHDLLVGDGDT